MCGWWCWPGNDIVPHKRLSEACGDERGGSSSHGGDVEISGGATERERYSVGMKGVEARGAMLLMGRR